MSPTTTSTWARQAGLSRCSRRASSASRSPPSAPIAGAGPCTWRPTSRRLCWPWAPEQALAQADKALHGARATGSMKYIGKAHLLRGRIGLAVGNRAGGEIELREALDVARRIEHPSLVWPTAHELALALASRAEGERLARSEGGRGADSGHPGRRDDPLHRGPGTRGQPAGDLPRLDARPDGPRGSRATAEILAGGWPDSPALT
jgi:hypothetical protein